MTRIAIVNRLPLLSTFATALFLAGCGLITRVETSTPPPTSAAPTATPPAATVAPPTPTVVVPTPTVPAAPDPLPAAVYFIAAEDGQIWRVARDGVTLTQVTFEAAPVTDYDLSPVDGALVYVAGNALILAAADGSQRQPVFGGLLDYPEDQAINNTITHPQWSPDGRRIIFGYGGLQTLDLDSPMLTPEVLLPSDPVPDPNAGRPPATLRFYRQAIWSPDGAQLLVEYLHYPEGGGWAMLRLNSDAALVDFPAPPTGGSLCCAPSWSLDGQYIYFASPYVGLGVPGLWRVTAATGQLETLLTPSGEPGAETYHMAAYAQQLADENLYVFQGSVVGMPTGAFTPLTMYRGAADTGVGVALRSDSYLLEEVLWAPDASGAVIMEVPPDDFWPFTGPLLWLPADGSAAVRLPATGAHLAWGR